VFVFGQNDPVHFGNLFVAMTSLYMVSNYEWMDILYVNMFGCDKYTAGMYTYRPGGSAVGPSISTCASAFAASGLSSYCSGVADECVASKATMYAEGAMRICSNPSDQRDFAVIYFVTFVIITSMVRTEFTPTS
jgi:hypothetical protein